MGTQSGLDTAIKVLSKIDDIGFSYLTGQDVVRHPLVQKIVMAYEAYESKISKTDVKESRSKFQRKHLNGTKVTNYQHNTDKTNRRKR